MVISEVLDELSHSNFLVTFLGCYCSSTKTSSAQLRSAKRSSDYCFGQIGLVQSSLDQFNLIWFKFGFGLGLEFKSFISVLSSVVLSSEKLYDWWLTGGWFASFKLNDLDMVTGLVIVLALYLDFRVPKTSISLKSWYRDLEDPGGSWMEVCILILIWNCSEF